MYFGVVTRVVRRSGQEWIGCRLLRRARSLLRARSAENSGCCHQDFKRKGKLAFMSQARAVLGVKFLMHLTGFGITVSFRDASGVASVSLEQGKLLTRQPNLSLPRRCANFVWATAQLKELGIARAGLQ